MLGQAVVAQLQALGHGVLVSGREVDVGQASSVLAYGHKHRPTHIINCAAYTKVDQCESDLAAAEAANAKGPAHLAQAAAALAVPIVHVSTDYVFDGAARAPYTEQAACSPLGAYGRSKLAGEQAFWAALADAPLAAVGYVVRTSWLFGHGGPNFVQTMLRLMAQKRQFGVVADQWGRPTYCDDLAVAIAALLGLEQADLAACAPGVYHFANTGAVSWFDFATGIFEQAQARSIPLTCVGIQAIGTQDYPTPAQRPAYSVLSTDKIAQALGYAPRAWQQALAAYLTRHWQGVQAANAAPNTSLSSALTPFDPLS
ncbi:hypothetical protein Q3G72_001438 [Acer saccharum]|nr:hypothetical protein Q3G72_001438 [Acer saccharum]